MRKTRCFSTIIVIIFLLGSMRVHAEVINLYSTSDMDIKFNNAFETILKAERAGAKINSLVEDLNGAEILFQQIKIALEEGDLEESITKSSEYMSICTKVEEEAQSLIISATNISNDLKERNNLMIRFSIISIIILSLIVWSRLKKYYVNRSLEMKPTVVKDDS